MDLAIDHIPKKGGFIFLVVFFVFEGRREQMVIGGLIIMERGYGGPSVYSQHIVYSFLHLYMSFYLCLCLLFCCKKLICKISAKCQRCACLLLDLKRLISLVFVFVLALETVRGGLIIMESGAWGTISIFPLLADYNMDCRRKPRISDKLFTTLDRKPFD